MKMRKILSFVLVLSLVLGSFSMAFAATPSTGLSDIAGHANEDAIQVNNDLGIIEGFPTGKFEPDQAVNRAQFAAMITRALAVPESALAGYTSTSFTDTTGYTWAVPYLAFAQSKGIMEGYGNNIAMPGKTISMNEAMTMVLRALGYVKTSAELVGAWPANYVTVAQNVGLYDDVAAVATVDRANAAQIIYNALTVQKVAVNADGETRYLTVGNTTEAAVLLNTGLGCDTLADVVLGVDAGVKYEDASINITGDLGAFGTAYTKDDKVVAFTKDSVALKGKVDGDKFKVGDVKYSFSTGTPASITAQGITNGNAMGTSTTMGAFALTSDYDTITLNVDLSGKTIKSVYSMVAWNADTESKVITAAELEDLDDNKLLDLKFEETDDDAIDTNSFELVGVKSLSDIKKDNVVAVYEDGNYIRKVAVGTEVVTGKVTEVKSGDYVVVNGKQYKLSDVDNAVASLPSLDSDVEMKLDAYGYIYKVDATGGSVDKYAVASAYTAQGTMDNAKVKLFTSDDTTKIFNFLDKDDVDWTTGSAYGTAYTLAASSTEPALVGYALDEDGYIDTFEATAKNGTNAGATTLSSVKVLKTTNNGDLDVSADVVVFTYDATSKYAISSIGNVNNKVNLASSYFQYITNADDEVVALLIDKAFDTKNADDVYGVINTVTEVMDGSTKVQRLVGFVDGQTYDKINTGSNFTSVAYNLYKFTENTDGKIRSFTTATGTDVVTTAAVITSGGISSDGTVLTMLDGSKYTVASNAVVYKALQKSAGGFDKYEVSKLTSITKGDTVYLFDTKATADKDGTATVVIYVAD